MAIDITEENKRILDEVLRTGLFVDSQGALSEALRLLKNMTISGNSLVLDPEKWKEKFEHHLAATPTSTSPLVDDRRESIYEDRGT